MNGLRAIFFDLDDTLMDAQGGFHEALEGAGRLVAERLSLAEWRPLFDAYLEVSDRLWANYSSWGVGLGSARIRAYIWREVLRATGTPHTETLVEEVAAQYGRQMSLRVGWLPGARETLERLGDRYALGVITNGVSDIQREKIRALKLETLCRTVLVGEECGCQKPDPRIFHRAMDELGVTPAESLMVGDRPTTDLLGAHGVGMHGAWICSDSSAAWPLNIPAPRFRLGSVNELEAALARAADEEP
jgi:HAD superfamily hydrolase (TIGR01549 family)